MKNILAFSKSEKIILYDKFLKCFYSVFTDIERIKIPYEDGFLRALVFAATIKDTKGFIVAHGGFDNLIEEFYYIFDYFRNLGYTVVAFEGPGQGYTLRKFGLTLTHDWEKPTKAVLDYLNINDATILGISLGGYWCLRAAAFEPRITRVVSYGLVYDFMSVPSDLLRKVTEWFLKKPKLMESSIRLKMKLDQNHRWSSNQWTYRTGAKSVGEVPMHMLAMNQKHMHPERITQDVLLQIFTYLPVQYII